ncbi:MAG TPA: hypothetical protein VIG47_08235 [Gemmatimonadaceae bacterium]
MRVRLDRRLLAAAVLLCWAGGLMALARRRQNVSDSERLAIGALRIDPATYYYALSRNGRQIGNATSAIDTGASGFNSLDQVRLLHDSARAGAEVTATSAAYLNRSFTLDSFEVSVEGTDHPLRFRAIAAQQSKVLLPTLAPIALILSRQPEVGESVQRWLYNPVERRVERVTLTIAAESLFSVVDSAAFDTTSHTWLAAHADTVRSWKITTPSRALSAWVDAHGRIVAASEPGGASLMRTTYEIALLNPKLLAK